MRSVLALGLLVTLCASADAAMVHHSKPHMSSFVTAKVWRSSKTRLLATTIPPNLAAPDGSLPTPQTMSVTDRYFRGEKWVTVRKCFRRIDPDCFLRKADVR